VAAKGRARRTSQVPATFLGFSLQTTRAVVRLLQADPGSFVSVEVLDDVGVVGADGHQIVEQTKSTTAITNNPIADRAVELWKTFAIWVDGVRGGTIDPALTVFELYVSTRRPGKLAHSFSAATDTSQAHSALRAAKDLLWGPAPKNARRSKLAQTLAPYVETVFSAGDDILAAIIERFSLVFGTGHATEEVLAQLQRKIVSDQMLRVTGNQMLGWTKAAMDALLQQGKPAVISANEFNAELVSFVMKYDRSSILNSFSTAPPAHLIAAELPTRTYIKQLNIIDADYETKLQAANDFLRAALDRSKWAEKGLVHRSSFDEFEETLLRIWTAKRSAMSIQASGRTPSEVGRLLYAECSQVQQRLETRDVPPHFTPGCFHALAEDVRVGWHPQYRNELTQKMASTEVVA
jgi:C-terminal domain 7 of the ABC-three component (ABC-3C) systems